MNKIRANLQHILFCFAALLAVGLLPAFSAHAQPTPNSKSRPVPAAPQLGARSYLLMDFDSNSVLVEHEADLQLEPASITKLMSSYVVFHELVDGNINLEDQVPISEKAWRTGGSRMFIDPSMMVTVEDLLRGMVIQSGNDASVALAEYVAGGEEAFADLMNHYSELLGMTGTHFVNSTGLPDPQHYTTARDVAILSAAIIREFPEYYAWYSEKEFNFNGIRQHNRNTLLWRDPAIDGLKTGHTEAAGYCLASSAKRDGMRLISVVMGSSSESSRASESQTLLNYGFRFFETIQLYQAGQQLSEVTVWKGMQDLVNLGIQDQLFVTIPRGRYDDLVARINVQPQLSAPLAAGQQVGMVSVYLDDKVIFDRPLVTLQQIEEAGFFGRNWDSLVIWVNGLFEDDEQ
jgi:D-alanyl-D-alanine carboxypeptidase (penicillin-binding protein 5/6)